MSDDGFRLVSWKPDIAGILNGSQDAAISEFAESCQARSDTTQWGPREWADVALHGTCQQCGWPRTVRTVIAPPGGFRAEMVCGKDASHAA